MASVIESPPGLDYGAKALEVHGFSHIKTLSKTIFKGIG
jgi:hypothetical protein